MRNILLVLFLFFANAVCAQTTLTIEGKTYTNSDATWMGVSIARSVPTIFTFRNNSITSVNTFGYMLQAGDEEIAGTNNNLDGSVITGNKFVWKGTDMKSITHGLFTGHNINALIKYNYLDHVPMGIIRKSANNMINTAGGVAYNIVKSGTVGINIKGMSNVKIFNNTLYTDRTTSETWRGLIYIYTHTDVTPNSVSQGTKIYNNIFYTKHQTYCIQINEPESAIGLESDYNIFYCESGTPVFYYCGSKKTFAEWQALGYDTHSKVINPNFKDLVNFVPAARLDYGKDLGAEWAKGLSVNARWGITDPETANQNGKWQVGAIVYKEIVSEPTPAPVPVYTGSVINEATPSRLEMTYNLSLANVIPATSAFTVKVNTVTRSISSVAISGTKVLITLASPVVYGDAITVAYTKPSTNPLQTVAGGQAASINEQIVTNKVVAPTPTYVSSAIENATPARLEMTYNLALANIIPAASAFTVKVNTVTRNISSAAISGAKVLLTLASAVAYGDVITVAYNKPSVNPLQTATGGLAASLSAQAVVNNRSAPVNQPPSVSISSPIKGFAFVAPATVNIDAVASDNDGKVVKVEFYNGTVKLGEKTTAPWSFSWKEVKDGSYVLTAAATDNSNTRTVSAPVTVVVEKAAAVINQLPSVTISLPPDNNGSLTSPSMITLTATASDPDGSIIKVEYFLEQVKLGESITPPWSCSFELDKEGTYDITAIAYDNLNGSATSAPVRISVIFKREYPDLMNLYPNPNNGKFAFDINLQSEEDKQISVTIFNISGRTVYSHMMASTERTKQIDISGSQAGNYIITVSDGARILSTKQFIKQ